MKILKITTAHLAKICDVSQGTVDRALHNRSDISTETKHKILSVANKYGYRESFETEQTKSNKKIGIIIFNLNNEYFSKLVTEIEYILRMRCTAPQRYEFLRILDMCFALNMTNGSICR